MMKRCNFWNDYPNLESNINSVWDGHKGEVRVSLRKLPDKSFRQTLSFIVFKAILMCRRSSVWESVSTSGSDEHIITGNFTQGRPALSLSLPRFSLSVSPSDMENCPSSRLTDQRLLFWPATTFPALKQVWQNFPKLSDGVQHSPRGEITSWLLTLWPAGWGKSI